MYIRCVYEHEPISAQFERNLYTAMEDVIEHQDRAPIMRHRQVLTFEELRDEAAAAVEQKAKSQAAVARQLGVTRGAVNRAVKEVGSGLADLQMRIIEHLTDYRIEPEPAMFRVLRKEEN